jgi:hypothetical protein
MSRRGASGGRIVSPQKQHWNCNGSRIDHCGLKLGVGRTLRSPAGDFSEGVRMRAFAVALEGVQT